MEEVTSYHRQYRLNAFGWQQAHDFCVGTAAVKARNTTYLPMPAAMLKSNAKSPDAAWTGTYYSNLAAPLRISRLYPPWRHNNAVYESYLRRARVPGNVGDTLRRLLGLATRIAPMEQLPDSIGYLAEDASPNGMTLDEYYVCVLSESLLTGRCGIMLDMLDESNRWTLKHFNALQCTNWKTNDLGHLIKVVLQEDDEGAELDDGEEDCIITTLYLNENGNAASRRMRGKELLSDVEISYMGEPFRGRLPFLFVGPTRNGANVDISALAPIVDITLEMYCKGADLAYAEFIAALPTLWAAGLTEDPEFVGAGAFIRFDDPGGSLQYTHTDADALSHFRERLKDLDSEAASRGANIVAEGPRERETAEGARIRYDSGNVTLRGAVVNSGKGIETLMKWGVEMEGGNPDSVVFEPSTEFLPRVLPAAEMQAQLQLYMSGAMSLPTLIENIRRAGMLPKHSTVEDEMKLIEQTNPYAIAHAPGINDMGGVIA